MPVAVFVADADASAGERAAANAAAAASAGRVGSCCCHCCYHCCCCWADACEGYCAEASTGGGAREGVALLSLSE